MNDEEINKILLKLRLFWAGRDRLSDWNYVIEFGNKPNAIKIRLYEKHDLTTIIKTINAVKKDLTNIKIIKRNRW